LNGSVLVLKGGQTMDKNKSMRENIQPSQSKWRMMIICTKPLGYTIYNIHCT